MWPGIEMAICLPVDVQVEVERTPLSAAIGITDPPPPVYGPAKVLKTIHCNSDEVGFPVKGAFRFSGTDQLDIISMIVSASFSVDGDEYRAQADASLNFDTLTFSASIDFNENVPFRTYKYEADVTVTLLISVPGEEVYSVSAESGILIEIYADSRNLVRNDQFLQLFGPRAATIKKHISSEHEADRGQRVLDVLLKRRADLIDIELSCANADTEIKYVDLVLEVLENAVSTPFPLTLGIAEGDAGSVIQKLDIGVVPPVLATELLSKISLDLEDEAWVDVVVEGSNWQLVGAGFRLLLAANNNQLTVNGLVPQTSDLPSQLNAQPEHFNAAAYQVLREAGLPVVPASGPAARAGANISRAHGCQPC